MRVAVLSDHFAERMGYSENLLPKYLARLGADVHVISSDYQPPFPDYDRIYRGFLGPRRRPVGRTSMDGFTLHRLPHGIMRHGMHLRGLHRLLARLRPDIVQCFNLPTLSTYQAALSGLVLGYRLFLEEHVHLSAFPIPRTWARRFAYSIYSRFVGPALGRWSERCYPIAPDAAEIAVRFFGYPAEKIRVCSLGVDTEHFTPADTDALREERKAVRAALGFRDPEIVCVYSGRLHPEKDPLTLARAIGLLQRRDPRYRALFVGWGTPDYLASLRAEPGCVIHPFVDWKRLPVLYRAGDIGVWPKQESTSQLDAAACGLPLILSNRVQVRERHEGNGLVFEEGNAEDLARKIESLANPELRRRLGETGTKKMREKYSWEKIARDRMADYQSALNR